VKSVLVSACLFTASPSWASVFVNDYADPQHPLCQRTIEIQGDSVRLIGTETSSNGGCSREEVNEYGRREFTKNGRLTIKDGMSTLQFDDRMGVWEAKDLQNSQSYGKADGIRWNDGTKWIVKSQSQVKITKGQYSIKTKGRGSQAFAVIAFAYLGLSGLAGVKGVYDTAQRKKLEN